MPAVTVLVPTFNRVGFLPQCLDSLLTQTLPPAQVIVIDDGSTDETSRILQGYAQRITVLEGENRGKPAALNAGLRRATGEYLWIFDDDDVALPDALERFVEPLEAAPDLGFSCSTFYYTTTEPHSTRLGHVVGESGIPDLDERGFLIPLLESNFLGGAALFARRACYDAVGDFDPALLRSQDYDMALRIALRFQGVRINGPATFHYRQHPGERGASVDRFEVTRRNSKWLEYDQMIFRRLHEHLPLDSYLPPDVPLAEGRRQAHLQRLYVLATKLLVDEAKAELDELANLPSTTPFTNEERQLIRRLVSTPYYRCGRLIDVADFSWHVHRRAAESAVIRRLRSEVVRSLEWRPRSRRPLRVARQYLDASHTALALFGLATDRPRV